MWDGLEGLSFVMTLIWWFWWTDCQHRTASTAITGNDSGSASPNTLLGGWTLSLQLKTLRSFQPVPAGARCVGWLLAPWARSHFWLGHDNWLVGFYFCAIHIWIVCVDTYVYIYRLIVYTLVGCVYITDICIYSMYTHKNSVVLCPFWMIIPLWVRPWIDLMARYDVEWKDVNIVGDSEDAAKNVMDGAFMVICKEGASVFVVWYASYSQIDRAEGFCILMSWSRFLLPKKENVELNWPSIWVGPQKAVRTPSWLPSW